MVAEDLIGIAPSSSGTVLEFTGALSPAHGVVKAVLVNFEEPFLTMHVAIGPLGLSLHLIRGLIYRAPRRGPKSKKFTFHTGAAIGIIGLGLWGVAASGARPARVRSELAEGQPGYYSLLRNHRCAPSGEELRHRLVVIRTLEDAWRKSHYGQPDRREVGGWFYQDRHGRIYAYFQEEDYGSSTQLKGHGEPPLSNIPGVVVALFHTHPNPTREGFRPDPSPEDQDLANTHKVPGLVMTDHGIFVYGPDRGQWDAGPVNCGH